MSKLQQRLQEAMAKFKKSSKQENISWTVCAQYKDTSFKHYICSKKEVNGTMDNLLNHSDIASIIIYKS